MFKGPGKIVRDNKNSSYPVLELTGVNCMFSLPTTIYLFEFSNNNSRIKYEICSKLTIEATDVVLVSIVNFASLNM